MYDVLKTTEEEVHIPRHSGDKTIVNLLDAVCACAQIVQKRHWCAIIGACMVNRKNMVFVCVFFPFGLQPSIFFHELMSIFISTNKQEKSVFDVAF